MKNREIDQYLQDKLKIETNFDIVRGIVNDNNVVYYLSSLISNNSL